uniref:NU-theraphotoxin-Preg1a n=1 Tax=Poecilotheria regalis TaxID=1203470 RepID=TXN1A_POERG|nr:RecName: Full=NU-theraphotoxin-Preg1a; Short=N-TRTX-Preg1a; Short=NU-TRTX-Preg1a [Poecilotheria regalis]6SAA_A Chain A, U1-theraphotoxin-Pf3 [Poecilotheria formosa]
RCLHAGAACSGPIQKIPCCGTCSRRKCT